MVKIIVWVQDKYVCHYMNYKTHRCIAKPWVQYFFKRAIWYAIED